MSPTLRFRLSVASVVVAALGVAWAVVSDLACSGRKSRSPPRRAPICIQLVDGGGDPEEDVFLLTPIGLRFEPDSDGRVLLPFELVGVRVTVHDKRSRRELMQFTVQDRGPERQRLEILRDQE